MKQFFFIKLIVLFCIGFFFDSAYAQLLVPPCPTATSNGGKFYLNLQIDPWGTTCLIKNVGNNRMHFPGSEIWPSDPDGAYTYFGYIGSVDPGETTYIIFRKVGPSSKGLRYYFEGYYVGAPFATSKFTYYIDGFQEGGGNGSEDPDEPENPVDPEHVEPCDCVRTDPGSIIRVDNLSFGESVPIAGTDFSLNYSSELTPDYVVPYTSIDRNPSFNPEGWSIDQVHYYDLNLGRLYHGSGRSFIKPNQTVSPSEIMVVDGGEVYIFSSVTGRHIRTLSSLTGYTKYTFYYNTLGMVNRIDDAFGNVTLFNRNSSGVLQSISSPFGKNTLIGVNGQGIINRITNPSAESYLIEYQPNSQLIKTFKKPSGRQSSITFDSRGRLKKTSNAGSGWNFDLIGNGDSTDGALYIRKTSSLGRQWKYNTSKSNSTDLYTRTERNPTGEIITYTEGANKASTVQTASGKTTIFTTDDERFGSLLSRKNYQSETVQGITKSSMFFQTIGGLGAGPFSYSTITREDIVNAVTVSTFVFNKSTMTTTVTTAEGVIGKYKIDQYERPLEVKTGSYLPVNFQYDSYGRIKKVTQGSRNLVELFYNSVGDLEKTKNARNEETLYTYDLTGRVRSVSRPGGRNIEFSYDGDGELIEIKPPGKPIHLFAYNVWGLLEKYSPPPLPGIQIGETKYSYNMDKQLIAFQQPEKRQLNFNYNEKGLLAETKYGDAKQTYAYIKNSSKIKKVVSFDQYASEYSYFGEFIEMEKQTDATRPNNRTELKYEYDNSFRVKKRTLQADFIPEPSYVNYSYDRDSRPTKIGRMSLTYNSDGRLYGTTIGNIQDVRTYDQYGDLETYAAYLKSGATSNLIFGYTLFRDPTGRIIRKTESTPDKTTSIEYSYDSSGNLEKVFSNGINIATYVYDLNGNRISGVEDGKAFVASYDDQDRVVTYGDSVYAHDASGSLRSVQKGFFRPLEIAYDPNGHAKSVRLSSGQIIQYRLDSLGRRVEESLDGLSVMRNIYAGDGRIIAQYDEQKRSFKEFVHATNSNSPDYMLFKARAYRIIKDHLGSPRLVVGVDDGTIVQEVKYDSWGKVLSDTNIGLQPYSFAGGISNRKTHFLKFGARDYDPEVGRWTSKDPILFNGGDTNLFGYAANDPVNFIDPTGLTQEDLDQALGYLATQRPELFFGLNPTFHNISLPFDIGGITLSPGTIFLDFNKLDAGTCEGSAERVGRYVELASHELRHAQDMRRLNIRNILSEARHDKIYDRAIMDKLNYIDGR
ncbi:RHS repeat domain-containing protein [Bdellovibrio sp. HCB-162]|uniref:RHS repeat domain-containing protein n=1 Tax=Bdellovibrio sp. HCB-162 TaxID=3394234 RepID=UPI0039BD8886